MMYSNKFVLCVLLNGKPQKEKANGQVPLPFGCEYALRLRNKNSRRAVVKIFVDGENVSGEGYIVNAHSHVDIKRHHDVDRAFKFVSLESEAAIDYGKDGPNEDGVKGTIEARFYLEKEQPKVIYRDVHHHHDHHHHHPRPRPIWPPYDPYPIRPYYTCGGGTTSSSNATPDEGGMDRMDMLCDSGSSPEITCSTGKGMASGQSRSLHKSNLLRTKTCSINPPAAPPAEELKDGCTVEGYSTGQNFHSVWCDTESTYTSLKIFLQGYGEDDEMEEEVAEVRPAKKRRKTNKDNQIDDLESENDELRRQLAELENEKLKAELEKKKAPKKRPRRKKTT